MPKKRVVAGIVFLPNVTFLPIQKTVEAEKGETILDLAIRTDVPLQHACGGFCACTTCHVWVKSGMENLSPMETEEQETLERAEQRMPFSRLSCQTKINGDAVLEMVRMD